MKTSNMYHRMILVAFCSSMLFLFSGCVAWTYVSGIDPIYPKSGLMAELAFTIENPTVDSLQPELKWEKVSGVEKYDMAIWDSLRGINADGVLAPQRRKIIYEKKGLTTTAHKVEIVLASKTAYFWSVRETGSEKWSTVTFHAIGPAGSGRDCQYFHFYTPAVPEPSSPPNSK